MEHCTIIGGGPVGATLACALATYGVKSRVVDRAPLQTLVNDTTSDWRAIATSPTSQNLLQALGIWNLVQESCLIREVRVIRGGGEETMTFPPSLGDKGVLGHIIPLSMLRSAIAQRVASFVKEGLIQWVEDSIESIEKTSAFLNVSLKSGQSFQTALLVGADGRHSTVRSLGGFEYLQWDYETTAIVCTYAHDNDHQEIAWEIFLQEGPLALLPLCHKRSSLVWSLPKDCTEALLNLSDQDFDDILREKLSPYLENPCRLGRRWTYPLSVQLVESFFKDNVVLVGDAAHVMHPLAGQGVNMGFRDIAALTEVITEGTRLGLLPSDPTVLCRYQKWRRFDTLSMIAVTHGLEGLFSSESQILRKLAGVGLQLINHGSIIKQILAQDAMGTLGNLPKLLRGKRI